MRGYRPCRMSGWLRAANKTTAQPPGWAWPVLGILMYHSYTPVPARRPRPPDSCSLRFVSRSNPSAVLAFLLLMLPPIKENVLALLAWFCLSVLAFIAFSLRIRINIDANSVAAHDGVRGVKRLHHRHCVFVTLKFAFGGG